jgi:hypothetical protein
MGRLLPLLALVSIALAAIALISCLSADEDRIRALPRMVWVFVILLFPPVGPIAYLLVGRPLPAPAGGAAGPRPGRRPARPVAPDDDPEFLRQLDAQRRTSDEELLKRWEEDLRKREERLRGPEDEEPPKP